MSPPIYQEKLEKAIAHSQTSLYLQNDPIRFPRKYNQSLKTQEVIALISALLAYGRVKAIGQAIETLLKSFEYEGITELLLSKQSEIEIKKRTKGFIYRFTTEHDINRLLVGLSSILKEFGSLGEAMALWYQRESLQNTNDFLPLLSLLRREILKRSEALPSSAGLNHLLSDPDKKSCCKRWHMFLRWMVRSDDVDLGCWSFLGKHKLLIPVDTHIHRLSLSIGLTQRKVADLQCAREITANLAILDPTDPVKYDFALAHLGITNKVQGIDENKVIIRSTEDFSD